MVKRSECCLGEMGRFGELGSGFRIRIRIGNWRAETLETREVEQRESQFDYCETRNTLCHVVGRDDFVSSLADVCVQSRWQG